MENNKLYPLKFTPIIKDPIWGGTKLRDVLNKKNAGSKSGESWEVSCIEGNISEVTNGFLAGNNLEELIEIYMGDLVGQKVFDKHGVTFPLLIKFIDACDDLSIQVHPNDEIAMQRHNSSGKTEMWYIMQADPGSQLIAGFSKEVSKEEYLDHLKDNTLLDIMNNISVTQGDVFFMPAGRIHAIGKGILLAEIQQTSNITYRLYDYNRTDAQGNSRDLHTEEAVDVIDFNFYPESKSPYVKQENSPITLASCQFFTTNLLELSDGMERDMQQFDSFIIYMCIEGKSVIEYHDKEKLSLQKGETVLVPAELGQYYIQPEGPAKLLEIYIEDKPKENAD